MNMLILLPLVLSLVFGLMLAARPFENDKKLADFAILATLLVSISAFVAVWTNLGNTLMVMPIAENLNIVLKIDGLGATFASLVCVLWPIATFYAKTYMAHEGKVRQFFSYYTLTFGVVLGLAFSENLFSLYLFYELLTVITLPLVAHSGDARSRYAGKIYIAYMIFGASLCFSGMMIFVSEVESFRFVYGGITTGPLNGHLLLAYVLMFVGFGIKAGLAPFHGWILAAGVAPTTVTALLHAVAVVKSGAFATMRLTYFLYDPEKLNGTIAQTVVLCLIIFSVVFGSYMAVRSQHLKRRLAFSTISQMSYILLGVASMSTLGLNVALLHMIFHGFSKIVLFYGVGNVLFSNYVEHLSDIKGYGLVLKKTFISMTICGLCIMGMPPFGGFYSKVGLAMSLFNVEGWGMVALVALILSAFFTTVYIFQIVSNAFLLEKGFIRCIDVEKAPASLENVLVVLTVCMIVLSCSAKYLTELIDMLLKAGVTL